MPTYPSSPTLTVDVLLKQPRLMARALTDLAAKRFVADRLLARGTSEQVAGGAAQYQKSESIYLDRDFEEVGVRAEFPRAGWSEAVFTAIVKKYGLEVPIAFESVRRNQLDQVQRAQRKLANGIVKFVDTVTFTMLNTDADVLTGAASGDWTTAATDIISDIATARAAIVNQEEGYEADTMIVNPAQELDLIIDADIRNVLPREGSAPRPAVITGSAVPILGLEQILVSSNFTAGTVFVADAGTSGTIADELPEAGEGYVGYNPGAGKAQVYVKRYMVEERDEWIVRCARFPAMWLSEPKSVRKITGA